MAVRLLKNCNALLPDGLQAATDIRIDGDTIGRIGRDLPAVGARR